MGKTEGSMETRTQSCLDVQHDHIKTLTDQLEALQHNQERHYTMLQENQDKFQNMVM